MSSQESRLLEIESAKVRHAWAKAELRRNPNSPALAHYAKESLKELRALTASRAKTKIFKLFDRLPIEAIIIEA